MFSVRKTTSKHGETNIHVLFFILLITGGLIWQYGIDYLIIFISSTLIHVVIEGGLAKTGLRKGAVYAYGYKLPVPLEVLLRSMVEGPAFCVPAFFVADQFFKGNFLVGSAAAVSVVGLLSLYMALADRYYLRTLEPLKTIISRRGMTRPRAIIALALVNTGSLVAFFLIPAPFRQHAFIYLIAYCVLVMLFYFLNYNAGVRVVELYDPESKEYSQPGPAFQAAGLTYTSIYEMAFLVSPAYWLTFYLGCFHYPVI